MDNQPIGSAPGKLISKSFYQEMSNLTVQKTRCTGNGFDSPVLENVVLLRIISNTSVQPFILYFSLRIRPEVLLKVVTPRQKIIKET